MVVGRGGHCMGKQTAAHFNFMPLLPETCPSHRCTEKWIFSCWQRPKWHIGPELDLCLSSLLQLRRAGQHNVTKGLWHLTRCTNSCLSTAPLLAMLQKFTVDRQMTKSSCEYSHYFSSLGTMGHTATKTDFYLHRASICPVWQAHRPHEVAEGGCSTSH